jgi:hypothetical protein
LSYRSFKAAASELITPSLKRLIALHQDSTWVTRETIIAVAVMDVMIVIVIAVFMIETVTVIIMSETVTAIATIGVTAIRIVIVTRMAEIAIGATKNVTAVVSVAIVIATPEDVVSAPDGDVITTGKQSRQNQHCGFPLKPR